jgi:hypothetical protein
VCGGTVEEKDARRGFPVWIFQTSLNE